MDYTVALDKIREALSPDQAAIIYTNENRRYLTGFPSSLGYLLIANKAQKLLVDGRYFEAACKKVSSVPVELLTKLSEQLCEFVNQNGVKNILLEDEVSLSTAKTVENISGCKTESGKLSELLTAFRSKKFDDELEYIRKAQKISEDAFVELLEFIEPGMTEKRIATELKYRLLLCGADDMSFDPVVVSGENSSLPHGVPTDKKVQKGDFITFDFGALLCGYHSDMTRTVAIGECDAVQRKVYDTVLRAQCEAIESIHAGVRCCDVDAAARNVINSNGYGEYFNHSTGHGVGIEIHEYPNLSARCSDELKPGYVVTAEPGIYLPGRFGVRIEDMIFVHENSIENITKFKKELIIL